MSMVIVKGEYSVMEGEGENKIWLLVCHSGGVFQLLCPHGPSHTLFDLALVLLPILGESL